uniref:Pyruvate dehydrogenase E1 component subunit beta n=1 Tax=Hordeum vulgare subsp. vulgare TaxID=112509 RepID=M0VBC6_HORVV
MSVVEERFEYLDAPIERIAGADVPMPYAPNLERLAVPQVLQHLFLFDPFYGLNFRVVLFCMAASFSSCIHLFPSTQLITIDVCLSLKFCVWATHTCILADLNGNRPAEPIIVQVGFF